MIEFQVLPAAYKDVLGFHDFDLSIRWAVTFFELFDDDAYMSDFNPGHICIKAVTTEKEIWDGNARNYKQHDVAAADLEFLGDDELPPPKSDSGEEVYDIPNLEIYILRTRFINICGPQQIWSTVTTRYDMT